MDLKFSSPPIFRSDATLFTPHLSQAIQHKACLMLAPPISLRAVAPHLPLCTLTRCLPHHFRAPSRVRLDQLSCPWRVPNRGKKSKATLKLDDLPRGGVLSPLDLPQGVIPLEPLELEKDAPPIYSTVVQQARSNMRKFENCVLLTRVGGFYELYFEHAEELAPLLNIKCAKRPSRPGAPIVSMVRLSLASSASI